MANELTVAREPDGALLVFTKRGSDGILSLQLGRRINIVSSDEPQRSIVAQIFTPQDVALYSRSHGGIDFSDLWSGNWLYRSPLQHFMLVFSDESDRDRSHIQLTASALIEVVVPIVFAMAKMQKLLFGSEPTIKGITQNSPHQYQPGRSRRSVREDRHRCHSLAPAAGQTDRRP